MFLEAVGYKKIVGQMSRVLNTQRGPKSMFALSGLSAKMDTHPVSIRAHTRQLNVVLIFADKIKTYMSINISHSETKSLF